MNGEAEECWWRCRLAVELVQDLDIVESEAGRERVWRREKVC